MKVCYHPDYNIDLGLLNLLHPFDGSKFKKAFQKIRQQNGIEIIAPDAPLSQDIVDQFVDPLIRRCLRHKEHILRALEVPNLPFLPQGFLEKRVLTPMRWGVAGTLLAARHALETGFCWNMSGGYHHASPHSIEGFCIYNDIGITCQQLLAEGVLNADDRILIIDTDAHHGNGNARTFMDNPRVCLLDVFNETIYPTTQSTRQRVDIPVALKPGTGGKEYLALYQKALDRLEGDFRLAFVIAGTDVLASDKLGGLALDIEDVVQREQVTVAALLNRRIPTVMLSGGGYSKDSALAIAAAIMNVKTQLPVPA